MKYHEFMGFFACLVFVFIILGVAYLEEKNRINQNIMSKRDIEVSKQQDSSFTEETSSFAEKDGDLNEKEKGEQEETDFEKKEKGIVKKDNLKKNNIKKDSSKNNAKNISKNDDCFKKEDEEELGFGEPTRIFYSYAGETMQMLDAGKYDEDGEMVVCNTTTGAHALNLYIIMKKIFKEHGFWDKEKKNALMAPFLCDYKNIKASGNIDYCEYKSGEFERIMEIIDKTDYHNIVITEEDFKSCKKEVSFEMRLRMKEAAQRSVRLDVALKKGDAALVAFRLGELKDSRKSFERTMKYYEKMGKKDDFEHAKRLVDNISKEIEKYKNLKALDQDEKESYKKESDRLYEYAKRLTLHAGELKKLDFESVKSLTKKLLLGKDVRYD